MPPSPSRRARLWVLPAAVGIASAGLFAAGAIAALSSRMGEPLAGKPAPTPAPVAAPPKGGAYLVVALGDSLTRGAGDAAGGGGYPARVARALEKEGRRPEVVNLSVDGSETGDLLRRLSTAEVSRQVAAADLLLVSIGGNDLKNAFPRGEGTEAATSALPRAREALSAIVRRLRELNPRSPVRLVGLYDPGAGADLDRQAGRRTLLLWNTAFEELSLDQDGVLVVPIADLFDGRPDRIASDRFHPGPSGYDEISARVVSTLDTRRSPGAT